MRGVFHIYYFMEGGLRNQPFTIENREFVEQAIADAEKALIYDPLNITAMSILPVSYIWSAVKSLNTSSKIMAARKSLVCINNLKKTYPDHYFTSLIIGVYHTMKDLNTLTMSSSDYEKAKEFLTKTILSVEKGINNDISDPLLMFAYQGALDLMIRTEYKYSFYSNAIYYSDIAIDLLKNEYNIEKLVDIYVASSFPKFMVGDYVGVIKDVVDLQRLVKQLPQTFNIKTFKFRSSLLLGYTYVQLGKTELGLDIINQMDTSFFNDVWWAKPDYYGFLALSYFESGDEENGIKYFNKNYELTTSLFKDDKYGVSSFTDVHNWVIAWQMLSQACIAKYLVEQNDITKAEIVIKNLEKNLSSVSEIAFFWAVDIPYFLALAYKGLSNDSEYNRYLNIAFDEIMKISNRLNDKHKQTYLNNVRRNREIIAMKKNI